VKLVLKLPRLSMNMQDGTIIAWRVAPGDVFRAGDVLYEVETEKVTSEVTAPCNGVLIEILAEAGADREVGDPVCRIEQRG
jgi:pyruvate/2-oxoglutarate dehydrogenase complex dihydrolipoamide acyltransferase (E2) component